MGAIVRVLGLASLVFLIACGDDRPPSPPTPKPSPKPPIVPTKKPLERLGELRITVVDEAGKPIPDARAVVLYPMPELEWAHKIGGIEYANLGAQPDRKTPLYLRTGMLVASPSLDKNGRATIKDMALKTGLLQTQILQVSVSAPGFRTMLFLENDSRHSEERLAEFDDKGVVELRFTPTKGPKGGIEGTITDEGGGLSACEVAVRTNSGECAARALSAPDGRFLVTGLKAGEYRVSVQRYGALFYESKVDVGSSIARLDVPLGSVGAVSLDLSWEGEGPRAVPAIVTLAFDEGPSPPQRISITCPGVHTLAVKNRMRAFVLTVDSMGLRCAKRFERCPEWEALPEQISFLAPEVRRWTARLIDGDRKPISNLDATLYPSNSPPWIAGADWDTDRTAREASSDEKGEISFDYLPPGRFDLYVRDRGFLLHRIEKLDPAAFPTTEVKLARQTLDRAISGVVLLNDGKGSTSAVPAVSVFICSVETNASGAKSYLLRKESMTDAEGKFNVVDLAPMHYVVLAGYEKRLQALPGASGELPVIDLRISNSPKDAAVVVHQGPMIYGRVDLPKEKRSTLKVRLTGDAEREARPDDNGMFVFPALKLGSYTVALESLETETGQRVDLTRDRWSVGVKLP